MNLIEYDPGARRPTADQGFETMGIPQKFKKKRGIEQVEAEGIGKDLLQPGALPCPPWAEQEKERSGRWRRRGMVTVRGICILLMILSIYIVILQLTEQWDQALFLIFAPLRHGHITSMLSPNLEPNLFAGRFGLSH